MQKKVIAALVCVAVAVVGCFLCFYKGRDELTFMQRQQVNQYLSAVPFEKGEDGAEIIPYIAVASQTDGYGAGEFLGARNQIDYLTGCIEVKVAVTDSGESVLSESYSAIGENPIGLNRVIEQMQIDSADMLVVNLSEYSRLSAVNYTLINSPFQNSCVITGVNENALETVKQAFPKLYVLCDYGKGSSRSLEDIKNAGASGIYMTEDDFDEDLILKAKEHNLFVWVDCSDDILTTVKAIKYGADGIVSLRPDFPCSIVQNWTRSGLDLYFERANKS